MPQGPREDTESLERGASRRPASGLAALLGILGSPRWLSFVVVVTLLGIGVALVFGPANLHGLVLIGFFASIFAGGLVLIVGPRGSKDLRLKQVVRRGSEVPTAHRPGFLRRIAWWKLTWTFDTPISMADSQKHVSDLMVYFKEARQWPFGDASTGLHISAEGFTTSPGWWWNAPYKVTVTGWCRASKAGSRCWLEIALAYDPAFEVLFFIASSIIAVGWLVALANSAEPGKSLLFVPLGFVPLAFVVCAGLLGRKWVKLRASGVVHELITDLQARAAEVQMGW